MKTNPRSLLFVVFGVLLGLIVGSGMLPSPGASVHAQEAKDAVPLLRTFKGHTKEVTDVAFSPDGKRLASSSEDESVRIWDTATGKELHTLKKAHGFIAQCVAFSPDGKWLASGGWDAAVHLWEPGTGRKVYTLEASGFDDDIIYSVAFSPDSKKVVAVGTLVAAGFDEPIMIWDVAKGKLERKLDSKITNGWFSVAFNHDGKLFATASFHSGIRLWDAATGRVARALRWDKDATMAAVYQVAFSKDGKLLGSAGDDRMIRLWDVETGKELRKFQGHAGVAGKGIEGGQSVTSVAFSPDGKLLASAGAFENTVRLWDVASGRQLHTIKGHTGTVTWVVFHPRGKMLATASEDKTVKLWEVSVPASDPQQGAAAAQDALLKKLATPGQHHERLEALAGAWKLAVKGRNKPDEPWSESKGTAAYKWILGRRFLQEEFKYAMGDESMEWLGIYGYDNYQKQYTAVWVDNMGTNTEFAEGRFDPKTGVLTYLGEQDDPATGGKRKFKWLITLESKDRLRIDSYDQDSRGNYFKNTEVTATRLPDQQASASADEPVKGKKEPEAEHKLVGHRGGVNRAAYSADSKLVATGSYDRTVKLWDARTGKLLHTLEGHERPVWSVAFNPKANMLASGSSDGTVRLWNTQSGELQRAINLGGSVDSVAFSPDGTVLAAGKAGEKEGAVALLNPQSGGIVRMLKPGTDYVTSLAFSPDGKLLAIPRGDQGIRFWDWRTGEVKLELERPAGEVAPVAFSPDGLVFAGGGRVVKGKKIGRVHFLHAAVPAAGQVWLWDAKSGKVLNELPGLDSVHSLAFSTDGNTLAGASDFKGTLILWDPKTGDVQQTREASAPVAFAPDGKTWVTGTREPTVVVLKQWTGAKDDAEAKALALVEKLGGKYWRLPELSVRFSEKNMTGAVLKSLAGLKQMQRLNLDDCQITDADLKELAAFSQLHELTLVETPITGTGFAELAGLKELRVLELGWAKITDQGLAALRALQGLEELELANCFDITDAGLKSLAALTKLEVLNLRYVGVTDAGVKELVRLKRLIELDLSNTKVTIQSVKLLAGLPELESLFLDGTALTDADLKELARFPIKLRDLGLDRTGIGDAGLKELAAAKQWRALYLSSTKVTDAGLKELTGLKQLTNLDLDDTKVTDAGLKVFAGLKQLEVLSLRGTPVTDAGLKVLASLMNLRQLSLHSTRVTDTGVAELQKALPKCEISR